MKQAKDIKKVCVVGAGAMGRGIALVGAQAGFDTYITDFFKPSLDAAKKWLADYLSGRVQKGKMTQEAAQAANAHMHFTESLEEAATGCDLLIEVIIEDAEAKKALFKEVDKYIAKDTVVATNSSSMPSSMFKDSISNPSRLANLHYFNPALVMKLNEVVQGEHTSKETVDFLMDYARLTGKDPIWLRKEIDSFVANRLLAALTQEAYRLVEMGICTPEEVDIAAEKGLNHPMGPFKVNDLVGLDVTLKIREHMYEVTGVKPVAYDIIKEKVARGELGRKSGKGWYDYTKQSA